jgi:phosphatidylserine/phosphatidylglycerophosphate/cardiolipin synthase-like enzyme
MWKSIQNATKYISLESYIFQLDVIGKQTLQYMIEAAKRGVEVTLIYDSWGSYRQQTKKIYLLFSNQWHAQYFILFYFIFYFI